MLNKICVKCNLEKEDVQIRGLAGVDLKVVDGKFQPGEYGIRYYGALCDECWGARFKESAK